MPSAEPVEVTAMKSMMAIITEPAPPKRYVAKVALVSSAGLEEVST